MNSTREKDERGRETVRGGWITDFPDKGKQNGDAGQAMQRTPKKFPLPHNLPVSNLLPFTFFHSLSFSLFLSVPPGLLFFLEYFVCDFIPEVWNARL